MSHMGGGEFLHGIILWYLHISGRTEPYSLNLRLIDNTLPPEGIVLIHIFKTQRWGKTGEEY